MRFGSTRPVDFTKTKKERTWALYVRSVRFDTSLSLSGPSSERSRLRLAFTNFARATRDRRGQDVMAPAALGPQVRRRLHTWLSNLPRPAIICQQKCCLNEHIQKSFAGARQFDGRWPPAPRASSREKNHASALRGSNSPGFHRVEIPRPIARTSI